MPEQLLRERALTSGGPGGQHANRSATRIELRVSIDALPLEQREKERLRERYAARLQAGTDLVVSVADSRSQLHNHKEARRRLAGLLERGLHVDPPRKRSRPSRGARLRAKASQVRHKQRKRRRRWRPEDEDG